MAVYEKGIEGGLAIMKAFRVRADNVKEIVVKVGKRFTEMRKEKIALTEEDTNNIKKMETILTHVQNYCYGIYFIYTTTVKLCDLVKILEGKKNFLLKLNSYKPDVEEIIDLWDQFGSLSSEKTLPRTKAQLKVI